jgi:hypothetical protein
MAAGISCEKENFKKIKTVFDDLKECGRMETRQPKTLAPQQIS